VFASLLIYVIQLIRLSILYSKQSAKGTLPQFNKAIPPILKGQDVLYLLKLEQENSRFYAPNIAIIISSTTRSPIVQFDR
jgi:hypothetical protein